MCARDPAATCSRAYEGECEPDLTAEEVTSTIEVVNAAHAAWEGATSGMSPRRRLVAHYYLQDLLDRARRQTLAELTGVRDEEGPCRG